MYQVPQSKSQLPENRFFFGLDGHEYSLPKMKFLKPKVAFAMQGKEPVEGMLLLFNEYIPGALDDLEDSEQLAELMTAWQKESEEPGTQISLGESKASATS